MYGIIQGGELVVTGQSYPDAKPVVYEDVPLFDQTKYYVVQAAPVDAGNHIYMGIEILELEHEELMHEEMPG